MVFGKNPNYPRVLTDNLSVLDGRTTSQIRAGNVNAMHAARQLLNRKRLGELSDQNSEILVIQNILQAILCTRKGTSTVIGQEGQQVLVKHRSIYMCVNPCKLQLKDTYKNQLEETKPVQEKISLWDSDNSEKRMSDFHEFKITRNYEVEINSQVTSQ